MKKTLLSLRSLALLNTLAITLTLTIYGDEDSPIAPVETIINPEPTTLFTGFNTQQDNKLTRTLTSSDAKVVVTNINLAIHE